MKFAIIPVRYAHLVYGVIQSGVTCGVATGISSLGNTVDDRWLHWLQSWAVSWGLMLPVVVLVSPLIRKMASSLLKSS